MDRKLIQDLFKQGKYNEIFDIITYNLELRQSEIANAYFEEFQDLMKNTQSNVMNIIFQLIKAHMLKESPNLTNKLEAKKILEEINKEQQVPIKYRTFVLLNLCDILLFEYRNAEDEAILMDFQNKLTQLNEITKDNPSQAITVEVILIKAQLATFKMDFTEASRLFTEAKQIAQEQQLENLITKVHREENKFNQVYQKLSDIMNKNDSVLKRIKESKIQDYMKESFSTFKEKQNKYYYYVYWKMEKMDDDWIQSTLNLTKAEMEYFQRKYSQEFKDNTNNKFIKKNGVRNIENERTLLPEEKERLLKKYLDRTEGLFENERMLSLEEKERFLQKYQKSTYVIKHEIKGLTKWQFFIFSSRFLLVGFLLAFLINFTLLLVFDLLVREYELVVFRFGLIILVTFLLYRILTTVSQDTKEKLSFNPFLRFIRDLLNRYDNQKNDLQNNWSSIGIYEGMLVDLAFIFTNWFFFVDNFLSIEITPGPVLFVLFIFFIFSGIFVLKLKLDPNEIAGYIFLFLGILVLIFLPMIIEYSYLKFGLLNYDFLNKFGATIFLLAPFTIGVYFGLIIGLLVSEIRKSGKIQVPEQHYTYGTENSKRYWNIKYLFRYSILSWFLLMLPKVLGSILLSLLGLKQIPLTQFRHPIISALFGFGLMSFCFLFLGFLILWSEKPRLFPEHPLKNYVRRLNSLEGNEYHYPTSKPSQGVEKPTSMSGGDLQLTMELPKYYLGKTYLFWFIHPIWLPPNRRYFEKIMNLLRIPIPSDIHNGEIICIPQIGLKNKYGKFGDLYFQVKIVSNTILFANICFIFIFCIFFLLILVFGDFYINSI